MNQITICVDFNICVFGKECGPEDDFVRFLVCEERITANPTTLTYKEKDFGCLKSHVCKEGIFRQVNRTGGIIHFYRSYQAHPGHTFTLEEALDYYGWKKE